MFKILLSSPAANKAAYCNVYKPLYIGYRGYLNYIPIWLLYAGGRVTTVLILKLCIKVGRRAINKEGSISNIRNRYIGGRPEGLPIEAAAVRLELILMRERNFNTPQSGANITAFGKQGCKSINEASILN